jgi:uncharacterized protein
MNLQPAVENTVSALDTNPRIDAHRRPFRYWSPWLVVFAVAWIVAFFSLSPDPVGWIEKNWVFIPIGVGGAILGNISAVGGGIVFIPCVIFIFHLPPVVALKIALATQSFGMTSGAVGWIQKRAVPMEALATTIPGLLIGSTVSSYLIQPSAIIIKALFGPISVLLGVLTLILMVRRRGQDRRMDFPHHARIPLFIAALVGGLITGWVAIGEGEVVAALLMLAYGVSAPVAIGLGVVLLSVNSIFLALSHQLFLGGIPWEYAAFTTFGSVFGARLAPWISRLVNEQALKGIFAVIAIGDGALFIYQYWLSLSH